MQVSYWRIITYTISNLAIFYRNGSSFKWGPSITFKTLEKQKYFHVKILTLIIPTIALRSRKNQVIHVSQTT